MYAFPRIKIGGKGSESADIIVGSKSQKANADVGFLGSMYDYAF